MSDLARLDVCFVAGNLEQGGAERQLFYMINELQRQGASQRLLCLTKGDFWEDKIRDLGVPVTWVGQSKSRLLRLGRIIAELRKHPPVILQGQHFYTNLYVVAAARALGLKEIGAVRSDAINEVRASGRVMGRLSLTSPRIIAANSRAAIQNAIAMGVPATRLHFLPNVVNTDQFKPDGRQRRGGIRLIAVGRLGREKRLDHFLSILSRLRKLSSVEVTGLIVGEGRRTEDQRPQLERQAAELDLLPGGVEFRGAVSDMAPIYREADIIVLTSDREGMPNVLLEAMASGLPVVATRVGDVPEIVRHGETGYLANPGDNDAMVDALLKLVVDTRLRVEMGCRAREYINTNYSLDRLPAHLGVLYKSALSNNHTASASGNIRF